MATRKIIDAKHNGEKVWLKGHAQATYMSNGTTVEDAINQIGAGSGSGGGIAVETDPIFLASPAASITEAKKTEWDNKMDKVVLSSVATSGNYNDLTNKPTIPASVTESTVSGWGFTKNTGTITGVSANGTSVATSGVANIPAASTSVYGVTKLNSSTSSTSTTEAATPSAVKAAYDLANSYKGTVTSIKFDGLVKTPTNGSIDLGYANKLLNKFETFSISLRPNCYYRCTSTTLSTLTITLSSINNTTILNEYFVEFTTSSSGTTVSLPSGIKWMNGVTPTFEASTTYQISIVNNLGTWVKFK